MTQLTYVRHLGSVSVPDKTPYRTISWSSGIGSLNYHIALQFDKHIGRSTTYYKFQSDRIILNTSLAASSLCEIVQ